MAEVVVYRRRTVVSLVMMLFALALGAAGYVLTSLNQNGTFPADWLMSAGPLQFGGPWYVGVAAWVAIGLGFVLLASLAMGYRVGKDAALRDNYRDCVAAGNTDCVDQR